jgi:predicted ArsR family transcriptional regulator
VSGAKTKEVSMTDSERRPWTFLTNHARVLLVISRNPDIRARDVAAIIGITERSAQRIVAELEEAGYLSRERIGRRNHYRVKTTATLRHPHERGVEIGLLLDVLANATGSSSIDEDHT